MKTQYITKERAKVSMAILLTGFLLLQPVFFSVDKLSLDEQSVDAGIVGGCGYGCTDECSYYSQKTCVDSTHYKTCGNYDCDACLEWSGASSCGAGKVCQNGQCVTSCTAHNYKSCYDNDVYWYNSCQQREEKYDECGSDSWTSNYQCSGNWVQRQKTLRGCSGSSCYTNTQWENYTDCSALGKVCQGGQCVSSCTDECSYYSQKTCVDSTHYKTCGNYDCDACLEWSGASSCGAGKTCQSGQCVTSCTAHNYKSCYDNDVYWYNSCQQREEKYDECGSDSWTNNYQCSGNWVQREKTLRGCSGSSCYTNTQWENYTDCSALGKVCQGGQCASQCQCGSWSEWQNQGCGQGGCGSTQMYQTRTRTCTPCGCSTESESRCIADSSCQPTCQDECAAGQTKCYDSGSKQTCGNYDSDSCLEWGSVQSCGNDSCFGSTWRDYSCSDGNCTHNDIYCSSNCHSCGDGICNSACGETQYNCSQDCGYACQDECAFAGQTRCSGNNSKQTCGNYDSDSCLEWGSTQSCQGSTACGYGRCENNQRPSWYCSGGTCDYNCYYDSGCGCQGCCVNCYNTHDYRQCYGNDVYWYDSGGARQDKYEDCGDDYCNSWGSNYCYNGDVYKSRTCYDKGCSNASCFSDARIDRELVDNCTSNETCKNGKCVKECECASGPCCDGCHYKNTETICKTSTETQYGCPWGIGCGADVGIRTRAQFRYCSGDNANCEGELVNGSWSSWKVNDYCSNTETCSVGDATCNYNSACTYTPVYNVKQCYDNDVYWFSPQGAKISKYMDCQDQNTCTLDRCDAGKCYYDLKCDGSTCSKDSSDYCSSCEHCGDGAANCEETFCSCPADVKLPSAKGIAISALAKESGLDSAWKKNISLNPGDAFSVMLVIASSADATIDQIRLANALPHDLIYQGNLRVDGVPFTGNIETGLNLGSLASGQSKSVTFDAKAAAQENFTEGITYLNTIHTVYYGAEQSVADNAGVEVVKSIGGVAAAGTIFGQIVKIMGSLAFWLVILFLIILGVIFSLSWHYFSSKRKASQFV